jgi:hypothetical protein
MPPTVNLDTDVNANPLCVIVAPRRRELNLAIMAAVGTLWSGALVVGLLAGVRPVPLVPAEIIAGVLVLPGFVTGVRTLSRQARNRPALTPLSPSRSWRDSAAFRHLNVLPSWAATSARTLFVLFWLAGITGIAGSSGAPEVREGQYVLNNHGTYTVVDQNTYERALDREELVFLSVWGGLGCSPPR